MLKRLIALLIGCAVVFAGTDASTEARADDAAYRSALAKAVRNAANRFLPSVVMVEIIGAAGESNGEVEQDAPTSGIIVDDTGFVIASSIVVRRPSASILVVLPDGSRHAAKVVARDHHRDLVLLKIKTDKPLTAVTLPDELKTRIGSTTIAVGRYGLDASPMVSHGVLSAVDRLDGIALQTDARVSPALYGGPLIDLSGNLLGVLIPAVAKGGAPDATSWYDSGIAFAIPVDVLKRKLDRLKSGEDINRGLIGIVPKTDDPIKAGTELAAVRTRSPAEKAGLKPGDEIISLSGHPVRRFQQIRQVLGQYDAGETIEIKYKRAGKTNGVKVELAESIPPLDPQRLGLIAHDESSLNEDETESEVEPDTEDATRTDDVAEDEPAEDAKAKGDDQPKDPIAKDAAAEDPAAEDPAADDPAADDPAAEDPAAEDPAAEDPAAEDPAADDPAAEETSEVVIDAIVPGSAADGKLQVGDVIVSIDGSVIADVHSMRRLLVSAEPDKAMVIKIRREGKESEMTVTPDSIAGDVAADVPELWQTKSDKEWKVSPLKLPDVANVAAFVAPQQTDDVDQLGLLVLLLNPGEQKPEEVLESWPNLAREHGVVVCAIAPAGNERWSPKEIDVVSRFATSVLNKAPVNQSAVAVAAAGALEGGKAETADSMALAVAISASSTFNGVAISEKARPPAVRLRENEADESLQLMLPIKTEDDLPTWGTALKKAGYPIVLGGATDGATLLNWVRLLQAI